jgi:signal transduction histidine kinase
MLWQSAVSDFSRMSGGINVVEPARLLSYRNPSEDMKTKRQSAHREAELLTERRIAVQSDLLRANRALGLLLLVALGLVCVAVYFALRSGRHQLRAEQAENDATERLWGVSLAQARAERTNPQAGHRAAALDAVRAAAAIRPSVELRNEAIAALRSPDFETEVSWDLKENVRGFAFDPDLDHYVTRYELGVVSMFRLKDNTLVREYSRPPDVPVECAAMDYQFSSTGKFLAVRYEKGPMVLFERDTGATACVIGLDAKTEKYSWPPTFTSDDRTMGVTMSGTEGTFVLYDIANKEPRRPASMPDLLKYTGSQNQVAVSPRGDLLAWFQGAQVFLIDAGSGALKHTALAPTAVKTLDWDQRGERLAFGCGNATLFLMEAASGRLLQLGGRTVQPWVQRFNEDGTLLLTAGLDGVTSLWDVNTAKLLCQSNESRGVVISKRGDRIGWGIPKKKVGVWRVAQPSSDTLLNGRYTDGATIWQQDFSSDGRHALWSPPIWTGAQALELFDPDRSLHAVLPLRRKACAGFLPGTNRIWMTAPGALTLHDWPDLANLPKGGLPEVGRVPLPDGLTPVMAAFSALGQVAAIACSDGQLYVVKTASPTTTVALEQGTRFPQDLPGPSTALGSGALAISPDGKWVVAGRDTVSGDPSIWDAGTGKLVARLPCPAAHVCFSPDNRWLVTIGIRQVQLWSVETWQERWSVARPASLSGFLGSAAFSGDGTMLAWTGDLDAVEITSANDGRPLASFQVSGLYPLTGLRFSADSSRLFATGPGGKSRIVHLGALRRDQLSKLGLDWTAGAPAVNVQGSKSASTNPGWLPILLGLIPAGAASLLGIALFRRQKRLSREFVEAVDLASLKERELAAEREVNELKSRFVTTVSHEFRTPLGITMSAVELLQHYEDRLPAEEKTQLLEDIHSSTRNMAGLMEQVLVLGRVDAGKLGCNPAPLDLEVFARKLTDEQLSLTNRKCSIEWTSENELAGAYADENLLRHIFTNLLNNAVKYSPEGSSVHFSACRQGPMAVFTIRDSGIGIPEEDMPHLFEAFHRASNVGNIPGTGLGLVLSKRCTELHSGSLQVQSKLGAGTTFTVRIPAWT